MLWVFLFLTAVSLRCHADVCPCETQELCQQIRGEKDFEVFVFEVGGSAWKSYNWNLVTTVAVFGKYDPDLMCYAHKKGARVVLKGDVPLTFILDPNNRTEWITDKVKLAKKQFMDGINLDIEQSVSKHSPEFTALTALVKETTEMFHREIPGSQVSFDVAWSPDCIDGRCYDYVTIAESCDLLFVMSYDEQSQIYGPCVAMANAPLSQTVAGYIKYLDLKIDPKKLIMGVPWYGYDYPCVNLTEKGECFIDKVPFRGAPCSDAAGRQVRYSTIMNQVNESMTGRLWDDQASAPYYNYQDVEGHVHQVWYDDPQSICMKSEKVGSLGLRGVGMWNGDLLDYGLDPVAMAQTSHMWHALLAC